MRLPRIAFVAFLVSYGALARCESAGDLSSVLQKAFRRTPPIEKIVVKTDKEAFFESRKWPIVVLITVTRDFETLEDSSVISLGRRAVVELKKHSDWKSGLVVFQNPRGLTYRAFEF